VFLKYQLKEIRAINIKEVTYSLKLKEGVELDYDFYKKLIRDLKDSKDIWYNNFIKEHGNSYFARANKLPKYLDDLEEEFLLNRIKDKVEYNIYK
jgi:hypothetical protein